VLPHSAVRSPCGHPLESVTLHDTTSRTPPTSSDEIERWPTGSPHVFRTALPRPAPRRLLCPAPLHPSPSSSSDSLPAPSSPPQTACSSPRSTAETAAPCSRAKPCTDRAARFRQRLLVQRRPRVVRSPLAASVVAARPLCSDDDLPSLRAPCSCRVIRTLLSVPFAKSNPAASPRAPSRCRSPQPRDPGTQRARTTPRGNTRSQPAGRGCEPRAPAEPLALPLSMH
jgi:hypothetical protein